MNEELRERIRQLVIRLVIVALPTAVLGYITLKFLNFSYTSLNTGITSQSIYFSIGLTASYALYYFRARWIVTFILLWILYSLTGKIISELPGEFDVFYATAKFELYSDRKSVV